MIDYAAYLVKNALQRSQQANSEGEKTEDEAFPLIYVYLH